ncbi:MAG: thermonuclease family protein, partial [candidate division WOR-3 bacterium]
MKRWVAPALLFFALLPLPATGAEYFKVSRVVDGDTIVLENGEKVRLIGIDTPEVDKSAKLHK